MLIAHRFVVELAEAVTFVWRLHVKKTGKITKKIITKEVKKKNI